MARYRVTRKVTEGISGAKVWTSTTTHMTKAKADKVAKGFRNDARGVKRILNKRGVKFSYRVTVKKVK